MNWRHTFLFARRTCLMALVCLAAVSSFAADQFNWRGDQDRVDAAIKDWPLDRVLARIAKETGWQVFVEPGTQLNVSVKFRDLKSKEALERMLGKLSFAILPGADQSTKLFVYRSNMAGATKRILPGDPDKADAKAARAIPKQLVVMLKPGAKIDDIARQLGAKVIGRVDSINAYLLEFPDQDTTDRARSWLSTNSDVASVDYNYSVDRPLRPLAGGAGSNPFTLSPQLRADGKTVIALIDTAVQKLDPDYAQFLLKSVSVAGDYNPDPGTPLHGTTMFEDIVNAMAASGANSLPSILSVDVYGNNPSTTTFDVAVGISQALQNGATVINMSLGSAGDSEALRTLIEASHAQGVIYTGAAGNEPTSAPTYPAAYPDVISVTASDRTGNLAGYANYSSSVDVIAPGQTVVNYNGQNWIITGTSASTAYVTGIAGGIIAKTGTTSGVEAQIRKNLQFTPPATSGQ